MVYSALERFGSTRLDLWHGLNQAIERSNYSQAELAQLLEISQPEVSALRRGDLSRFSIDRLLAFLERFGENVEIRIAPGNGTGSVKVVSEAAVSNVLLKNEWLLQLPSAVIIVAGAGSSGRTRLLESIARHHEANGTSVLFFGRQPAAGLTNRVYTGADDFHDHVVSSGAERVIAIDDLDLCGDEAAWAPLHFARRGATVYVTLKAANGALALGAFRALLGRAYSYIADDSFMESISSVIALLRIPGKRLGASAIATEISHPELLGVRRKAVIDRPFAASIADLVDTGDVDEPVVEPRHIGPLSSAALAAKFLEEVGIALSDYSPVPDRNNKLGLEILNAANGRRLHVQLALDRHRKIYDVFISTDEADDEASESHIPESCLFAAPADVSYVVTVCRRFLEKAPTDRDSGGQSIHGSHAADLG